MKNFILVLFIFTGILCHSKNEISLNFKPNDSIKILKKIIKNYENGVIQNEEVLIYSYENDVVSKIVTTTNNDVITEEVAIKYENGKLTEMLVVFPFAKIKRGKETLKQLKSVINVFYNYDDDLIQNSTSYENGKISHIDYFIYDTNKQVIKKEVKVDGILKYQTKYTFNKEGNLLKERGSDANGSYDEYDDKRNPFDLVFPEPYLKILHLSKNNYKSCNRDSNSYTYEYEYNASNYPIKIIKKSGRKTVSETIIEYSTNQS